MPFRLPPMMVLDLNQFDLLPGPGGILMFICAFLILAIILLSSIASIGALLFTLKFDAIVSTTMMIAMLICQYHYGAAPFPLFIDEFVRVVLEDLED